MSESEADPFMPRTIRSMIPKGRSVLPRGGGLSNTPVSYARPTTNFLKGRGSMSGTSLLAKGGSLPKGHSVLIPGGGMVGTSLFKMKHYDPYESIKESPTIQTSNSGIVQVNIDPANVNKETQKRAEEEALELARQRASPIDLFKKKMSKADPKTREKVAKFLKPTPPATGQVRSYRQNFAMETPEMTGVELRYSSEGSTSDSSKIPLSDEELQKVVEDQYDAQSIPETVVTGEKSLPSKYLQKLAVDKGVWNKEMPPNSKNRVYIVQKKEENEWKIIRSSSGVINSGSDVDKIKGLVLDKNKLQKVGDVYSIGKFRVTMWTKKVKVDYGDLLQGVQEEEEEEEKKKRKKKTLKKKAVAK